MTITRAVNFLENLLSDDLVWDQGCVDASLNFIPNIVSDIQNKDLTTILYEFEIKETIFSFEGNKAHEPHGFSFLFFQAC
jgi:hypothetical protein